MFTVQDMHCTLLFQTLSACYSLYVNFLLHKIKLFSICSRLQLSVTCQIAFNHLIMGCYKCSVDQLDCDEA